MDKPFLIRLEESDADHLLESSPSVVIQESWIKQYEDYVHVIWYELVRMNGNIFVLDKITSFPWAVFEPVRPTEHFWLLTRIALYESTVLGLWRLASDDHADVITLPRLRRQVNLHVLPKHQEAFRRLARAARFSAELKSVRRKIEQLRQNHIAHLNVVERLNAGSIGSPPIVDLRRYCDRLSELFRVLCFGKAKMEWPLGYFPGRVPSVMDDPRTDIERTLDAIAEQSSVMQQFRKDDDAWRWRWRRPMATVL